MVRSVPVSAGILVLLLSAATLAQTPMPTQVPQPYAGQEHRTIKALAPQEVADLLAGRGMGLAKAAELNHYPGPSHALELADRLGLSESQRAALADSRTRMTAKAVDLGRAIVDKEADLDRRFAGGRIDLESLEAATAEIAVLQGRLRAVHLAAHLETKAVLTPEQVARYDVLRGYTGAGTPKPAHGHGASPGGAHGAGHGAGHEAGHSHGG